MSATVSPPPIEKIAQLEDRIRQLEAMRTTVASSPPSLGPSLWFTNILQGLTLTGMLGAAFWLGSLSATGTSTSTKVDRISEAVSGPFKESLSSRAAVIETKLDEIQAKVSNSGPKKLASLLE